MDYDMLYEFLQNNRNHTNQNVISWLEATPSFEFNRNEMTEEINYDLGEDGMSKRCDIAYMGDLSPLIQVVRPICRENRRTLLNIQEE